MRITGYALTVVMLAISAGAMYLAWIAPRKYAIERDDESYGALLVSSTGETKRIEPEFSLTREQAKADWKILAYGYRTRRLDTDANAPITLRTGFLTNLVLPKDLPLPQPPYYVGVTIQQVAGDFLDVAPHAMAALSRDARDRPLGWDVSKPQLLRFLNEHLLQLWLHAKGRYQACWHVVHVQEAQTGRTWQAFTKPRRMAAEWEIGDQLPKDPVLLKIDETALRSAVRTAKRQVAAAAARARVDGR